MNSSRLLLAASLSTLQIASYPAQKDLQTYYLIVLTKGPAWTAEASPALEELQRSHTAHLGGLGAAGKAPIAGPFGDDGDVRGVVIVTAATRDEAASLERDDPAVKAGRLASSVLPFSVAGNWFAFAPLKGEYSMRRFVFAFLTRGPAAEPGPEDAAKLENDHLAYLWGLHEAGSLVLAGSIANDAARRELVVLAMDSLDKARAVLLADPRVVHGDLALDLHSWYAADGVMQTVR